jgi:hypothetical protein
VDRISYPSETDRMLDRYAILLRKGFILGEDRGISLERATGSDRSAARVVRDA